MDDVQKVGYSGPFSSITSPSPPSSPPSTFTSIWFVWTHVDLKQLLPLRGEVEWDSIHVAGQGGGTHEEDDEDAIWEKSGEVDELAERLYALPESAVDENPGEEKATSQL